MSSAYDKAFNDCLSAAKDAEAAEATRKGTKADLVKAGKAYQAFIAKNNKNPVAGDPEYDDLHKAKFQDASADKNVSATKLELMIRSQKLQELARGSGGTVPTPPTPKMGGLIQGQHGKEAWTGGKPKADWSDLDPQASLIPIATQMRSNSSKAATAMLKRSEGIFNEESLKFKHQDDLDYFLQRIEAHFVKNGMDSITYRPDPTTTAPGQGPAVMLNLFNDYPKFNKETVGQQNTSTFNALYDEYDKQNDNDAIESFLDSLSEPLRKKILGKVDKEMKFSEIFMIFIDNEHPQSGDLYNTIEKRVLALDVTNYPGANISDMVADARKDILALEKANAYDSRRNIALCRLFTEAGGPNNSEYSTPMYDMLKEVKKKVSMITHMNNQDKIAEMNKVDLGWKDILQKAEDNYKELTTNGNVRWPPQCNPMDLKAPANNFGAHLTQCNSKTNGNHKCPNATKSSSFQKGKRNNNGKSYGNGN